MRGQGQTNALGIDIVFGGMEGVSLTRSCELGNDLVPVELSQTEESPLSDNETPSNPCTWSNRRVSALRTKGHPPS